MSLIIMPMQERVAMSLHGLGSGDRLQSIRDLHGVHKCTLSKVVEEFCKVVRKHLQPVIVQTPSVSKFKALVSSLSNWHL